MKAYTIVRVGWEYNDEYYHRPESDGGTPQIAYKDRTKAEAKCLKLNIEHYRELASKERYRGLTDYFGYDGVPEEELKSIAHLGVKNDGDGFVIHESLTDKQMAQVISALGVVFYEIVPIDYVE